jgi:SPP1 gp7 family putative phage head morphogenesis protein
MNKYWEKRIAENLKSVDKTGNAHMLRLKKFYGETLEKVDHQINKIYVGMLQDGGVTTTNLYSAGRFMQLKNSVEKELGAAGRFQTTQAQKTLEAVYEQTLNKSYIDLNSSLRFGFADKSKMEQVLKQNWAGINYSERIWNNTTELAKAVETHIRDLVSLGKMPNNIKKQIMKDFNIGLYQSDRLIRTEAMHVFNEAAKDSYINSGVAQIQILVSSDERLCDECGGYADKIYPINSAPILPFHPNCRCCIIPIVKL